MGHSVFGGIMRRDYPLQYPVATPIVRRIRSAVLIHATRHVHELVPPGYCARRCRTGRTLSLPVPTSAMFDRAATAYRLTTMSGRPVTVAVVQAEVAPDLVVALERTAAGVQAARAAGATLVVFPETWVPGYPAWIDLCRDAALWDHTPTKAVFARMARDSVAVPGPAFDALAEIAREAAVTLVVGVSERVESGPGRGTLYNALLTLAPTAACSITIARRSLPTPSVWCGVQATRRGCEPWRRRPAGSEDWYAGSTGCRSPDRRCTNRERMCTLQCGRQRTRCTRWRAVSMRSRVVASCSPPDH